MVFAALSSDAKDDEHTHSGRSPGFWLQTLLMQPSHSHNREQWLLPLLAKRDKLLTSYSSATASDLHRLPYYAQDVALGHPMGDNGLRDSVIGTDLSRPGLPTTGQRGRDKSVPITYQTK